MSVGTVWFLRYSVWNGTFEFCLEFPGVLLGFIWKHTHTKATPSDKHFPSSKPSTLQVWAACNSRACAKCIVYVRHSLGVVPGNATSQLDYMISGPKWCKQSRDPIWSWVEAESRLVLRLIAGSIWANCVPSFGCPIGVPTADSWPLIFWMTYGGCFLRTFDTLGFFNNATSRC